MGRMFTSIDQSLREFDVTDVQSIGRTYITLGQIGQMENFDRVTVSVKAIRWILQLRMKAKRSKTSPLLVQLAQGNPCYGSTTYREHQ